MAEHTAEEVALRRERRLHGMGISVIAGDDPNRPAIVSPSGDRTFGELNARANQLARAWRTRGFQPGDHVALVISNRPEFAEVLYAGVRSGARITPINWHLTGEEIAYIVNDCEAKVFVGDARFAGAVAEAGRLSPHATIQLAVGGDIDGFDSYDAAIEDQDPSDIEEPTLGRTMLYTSGTTGRPKGVDRAAARATTVAASGPDANPAATNADPSAASATGRAARYNPGTDLNLCTGPLYHAAPLAFSLTAPIAVGVGVVVMDGWDPEETLRLIEKHRITHSHMVPTMFHRLLAVPEDVRAKYDISTLRYVLHGAAPCPVDVKKRLFEWLGPIVYEYYAATEGGGSSITPQEWLEKPGSVGRPNPGQHIEVWDDEGKALPPLRSGAPPADAIGTVFFKAPENRFRYYKDDKKTESAYRGEFFTLGDMGYFDEDGYLFLTGRSAEVIISGGVNIYPAEVDAVLLEHPAVADSATVGAPNDEWGEEVRGVVQLKAGIEATPELAQELIAFTRDRLAHYKCPKQVDFDEELPRHDTGKIYRRLVRDRYWAGRTITI